VSTIDAGRLFNRRAKHAKRRPSRPFELRKLNWNKALQRCPKKDSAADATGSDQRHVTETAGIKGEKPTVENDDGLVSKKSRGDWI
jgi:hypothetical protein